MKSTKGCFKIAVATLLATLLTFVGAIPSQAASSTPASVNLTLTIPTSITVTPSVTTAAFTILGNGQQATAPSISVTATWSLPSATGTVTVYQYFATTTALQDGCGTAACQIPTSAVTASVNGGTQAAWGTAANNCPAVSATAVCGPNLSATTITAANQTSSVTNTTLLAISGIPTFAAGSYTGTLNFEAVAL